MRYNEVCDNCLSLLESGSPRENFGNTDLPITSLNMTPFWLVHTDFVYFNHCIPSDANLQAPKSLCSVKGKRQRCPPLVSYPYWLTVLLQLPQCVVCLLLHFVYPVISHHYNVFCIYSGDVRIQGNDCCYLRSVFFFLLNVSWLLWNPAISI